MKAQGDDTGTHAGTSVTNDDASQGEDPEENWRQNNLNMRRLIDGIGGLLAASAALLARLQQILGGAKSGRAEFDEESQTGVDDGPPHRP